MALSGDVSKSMLIVKPAHCTPEFISAVRVELFRRGFVIVREEWRSLTQEAVEKISGDVIGSSDIKAAMVGQSFVIVVARADAANELLRFAEESAGVAAKVFCCGKASAKAILVLFPRMIVDPIPTNAEARDYVSSELQSLLVSGLTEVGKKKPEKPIEWLANYLMENNPRRPPVSD